MSLFSMKSRRGGMTRATLLALFDMDARRLNDLGLTHYDIAEALRRGGAGAGALLDARRSERASHWLR